MKKYLFRQKLFRLFEKQRKNTVERHEKKLLSLLIHMKNTIPSRQAQG